MKKKFLIPIMVLILVIGAIGGTLAWLYDTTGPVTNTFTVGKVDIDLNETDQNDSGKTTMENSYKLIPGKEYSKDPKVTVTAESENSWVFVKVEKMNNIDSLIDYKIRLDQGEWSALTGHPDVYYREYTGPEAATYYVLKGSEDNPNGCVTIKSGLTNEDLTKVTGNPQLKFTAYAIQKDGFDTPEAAWKEVSKPNGN